MPVLVYGFLLIELIFVAYIDFKYKRISNTWSLINLVMYFVLLFLFPKFYSFELHVLFFPLAWFAVGLFLFALKIMGAGDSKFLMAFFLLIPLHMQESVFFSLTYVTIFVGILLFFTNTLNNIGRLFNAIRFSNIYDIKSVYGKRFSFAPVILLAWMLFGWINRDKFFY